MHAYVLGEREESELSKKKPTREYYGVWLDEKL